MLALTLLVAGFLGSVSVTTGAVQDPEADNTNKNLPANHADANRADQQSHSPTDVEMTRKIRQALTQDKSLSTYGHNIKVITRNGVVHLKGPVTTPEEKVTIKAKAAEIAGASNIRDEITVKAHQ
jgi:hyperosmotically inducible protein